MANTIANIINCALAQFCLFMFSLLPNAQTKSNTIPINGITINNKSTSQCYTDIGFWLAFSIVSMFCFIGYLAMY